MHSFTINYDEDSFTIYLIDNDAIVGIVSVNFNYIASLFVSTEHRRQGLGTHLLTLAEQELKHYVSCTLHALPSDTVTKEQLHKFYTGCGYTTDDNYKYTKLLVWTPKTLLYQ